MLHVLLIGINEYAPGSGVRNLSGCVNDVKAMQAFLLKHYAHLQPNIRTLTNAEATREGVIKAFRAHLTGVQIKAGDQVLFYYSGHGSFGPTAPEFAYNDPSEQDETMVCYDSRLPGKQDLSDKERGALLAEIPKGAQVLFIIDSCHAASSLRKRKSTELLGASRFQPGQTTPRTLDSYQLAPGENIYLQQKQQGQKISVPERPFTLLAACDRAELAMETRDQRGLFTKILLEVLENAGTEYTYEELMQRVHFLVNAANEKQRPVLETFQSPRLQVVLSEVVRPNQVKNIATYQNGHWQVNCGAIHGMPTDVDKLQSVTVQLYSSQQPKKNPDVEVKVKSVFATYSILDTDLGPQDFFWAAVDFSIALPVAFSGDEQGKKELQNLIHYQGAHKNWHLVALDALPKYEIQANKGVWQLKLRVAGQILYGPTDNLMVLSEALNQIARWEQLSILANPESKIQQGLEVEFCEEPKDNSALIPFPKQHQLSFVLNKKQNGETETLWYHLRARNTLNQPLHVALLYLSPGYAVEVHYMRRILPPKSAWVKLDEMSRELELASSNKSIERFLVLYSTAAFEEFQYEQAALGSGKRDLVRRNLAGDDWATQLFEVELRR